MDGGLMDEDVFAAIVRSDKPEPFTAIEPLHGPGFLATTSSSRSCCNFRHLFCYAKNTSTEAPFLPPFPSVSYSPPVLLPYQKLGVGIQDKRRIRKEPRRDPDREVAQRAEEEEEE